MAHLLNQLLKETGPCLGASRKREERDGGGNWQPTAFEEVYGLIYREKQPRDQPRGSNELMAAKQSRIRGNIQAATKKEFREFLGQ